VVFVQILDLDAVQGFVDIVCGFVEPRQINNNILIFRKNRFKELFAFTNKKSPLVR